MKALHCIFLSLCASLFLYIPFVHAAKAPPDLIVYHTVEDDFTFSLVLDLPPDNKDQVCVEGRRGNSTQGAYDIQYCSKASFHGYRPDLCKFLVGPHLGQLWTFIIASPPTNTNLTVEKVRVYHEQELLDTNHQIHADQKLDEEESKEDYKMCCGASATHIIDFKSSNSEWGTNSVTGELNWSFILTIDGTDIRNVDFFINDRCTQNVSDAVVAFTEHDPETNNKGIVNMSPEMFHASGWGTWFLTVKPKSDSFSFTYRIEYQADGEAWHTCPASDLGLCSSHGTCDKSTGKCACAPCFTSGPDGSCGIMETCSGNGYCNTTSTAGECKCNPGYSGTTCEFGDGIVPASNAVVMTGGGAAFLAIGMFVLGSVAGIGTLLIINKKIRKAVYSEVSIRDPDTFEKAVS